MNANRLNHTITAGSPVASRRNGATTLTLHRGILCAISGSAGCKGIASSTSRDYCNTDTFHLRFPVDSYQKMLRPSKYGAQHTFEYDS